MTYLHNLLDLILAHWLLRNLRRELSKAGHDHELHEALDPQCPFCRKLDTVLALEAHIAELESKLK